LYHQFIVLVVVEVKLSGLPSQMYILGL